VLRWWTGLGHLNSRGCRPALSEPPGRDRAGGESKGAG
jgi:hypothetical protein